MTLSRVAFLLLGTLALLLAHIQPTSATRRSYSRDVPKTWLCSKGKYSRYNSFEIFELTEGGQITPAPENGASYQPGEEYYYKDPLVSYWKGESAPEQIGSVSGTCFVYEIIALPSSNKNYCINTYSLDGQGTIGTTGDFIDRTGDVGVEAITGGTGKFKGASGEVRTTIIEQGRKFKHEFHLTSPFYCK